MINFIGEIQEQQKMYRIVITHKKYDISLTSKWFDSQAKAQRFLNCFKIPTQKGHHEKNSTGIS